jgi:hypothetical protein
VADGLGFLEATTSLCGGQAACESSGQGITTSRLSLMMEASCGLTIDTQLTTMACMGGALDTPEGTFVQGGILCELRCLSVVAMLGCFSGTMVLTPETVGLLRVQVDDSLTVSRIAMVSSGKMPSTLVKVVVAKI